MKVIFLDIDGVIQPCNSEIRFTQFCVQSTLLKTSLPMKEILSIDFEETEARYQKSLSQSEKENPIVLLQNCLAQIDSKYNKLDKYDIAAVCCDWNKGSVKLLRQLCDETDAKFVISSDWRRGKSIDQLKLLFRIHGLDDLVIDVTSEEPERRHLQIKKYLEENPNITRFAILDDYYKEYFEQAFPSEFVHNVWCFTIDTYRKAKNVLLNKSNTKNK